MCPEVGELIASYEHLVHVLQGLAFFRKEDERDDHTFCDSSKPWPLLKIWADHTKAEIKEMTKRGELVGRAAEGQMVQATKACPMTRGNVSGSGSVWPLDYDDLTGLNWVNVQLQPKSLVLDFQKCVLDMHYLTHTSIQIYPRRVWEERILDLPANTTKRSFKVIMALEFEEFILGFLSKDNLAQPEWSETRPPRVPEIFPGFQTRSPYPVPWDWWNLCAEFLDEVIKDWKSTWAPKGHTNKWQKYDNQLAIYHFRTTYAKYFPGLGAFTILEVFFLAGLPPFLTVWEVVSSPSRFARFLEAYYFFVLVCKLKYWRDLVRPTLQLGHKSIGTLTNTIASPTVEQRAKFGEEYLHVYAQSDVEVHEQHAVLIRAYTDWILTPFDERLLIPRPADPYNPNLIEDAMKKKVNLRHLIHRLPLPTLSDPITAAYSRWPLAVTTNQATLKFGKAGLVATKQRTKLEQAPTFLKSKLSWEGDKKTTVPVYFYPVNDGDKKGQIWSVLPPGMVEVEGWKQTQHTDAYRHQRLFKTIVTESNDVSIGPLEYCGYSEPMKIAGTLVPVVSNVDFDRRKAYQLIKSMRKEAREALGLGVRKENHRRLTPSEHAAIHAKLKAWFVSRGWEAHTDLLEQYRLDKSREVEDDDDPDEAPRLLGDHGAAMAALPAAKPAKKRKRNADSDLCAEGASSIITDGGRTRRQRGG